MLPKSVEYGPMDTARVSMIVLGAMALVDRTQSFGSISQTEVHLHSQLALHCNADGAWEGCHIHTWRGNIPTAYWLPFSKQRLDFRCWARLLIWCQNLEETKARQRLSTIYVRRRIERHRQRTCLAGPATPYLRSTRRSGCWSDSNATVIWNSQKNALGQAWGDIIQEANVTCKEYQECTCLFILIGKMIMN